jgi:phage-related protein
MDTSYMQFLLYILGAILLGALIVLVIKIVYSVNHINAILESVEMKMKTVDKAFGAVDRLVDSFSAVTDKVVDGIASGISKVFSRKKKKSKIDEDLEEE